MLSESEVSSATVPFLGFLALGAERIDVQAVSKAPTLLAESVQVVLINYDQVTVVLIRSLWTRPLPARLCELYAPRLNYL